MFSVAWRDRREGDRQAIHSRGFLLLNYNSPLGEDDGPDFREEATRIAIRKFLYLFLPFHQQKQNTHIKRGSVGVRGVLSIDRPIFYFAPEGDEGAAHGIRGC